MNESIVFYDRIPKSYKLKSLGEGACGKCYLTKDNKVFKQIFPHANDLYLPLKNLSRFESDFISFPKQLVYLNEEDKEHFKGYLMDYYNAIRFRDVEDKIDILVFLEHLRVLEEEIKRISDERVTFFDLSLSNTLYSESIGIRLIDTDLYETELYESKSYNLECNMIELSEVIMQFLFGRQYTTFVDSDLNYKYQHCGCKNKLTPSEFLYEFIEYVNKNRQTDVKTLRQLRNKGYSYYY